MEHVQEQLHNEMNTLNEELRNLKNMLRTEETQSTDRLREMEKRSARITRLEQSLKQKEDECAAVVVQRNTLNREKTAFEAYYEHKRKSKHFQGVRSLFGEHHGPEYRPWYRFLPAGDDRRTIQPPADSPLSTPSPTPPVAFPNGHHANH
jgi:ribosomal protein L29